MATLSTNLEHCEASLRVCLGSAYFAETKHFLLKIL